MTTSTSHLAGPATVATPQIAVISASVRADRMCPSIADWVVGALTPDATVDLIDLAEVTLPDDSLLYPGGGPKSEVAGRIEAAEAFVFVTPEYNHSYPASLKRLIDWHYSEWELKPATIVGYGVYGGHSAIEHLRGVLAELSVVTTRRVLGLSQPWEHLSEDGGYTPDEGAARGLAATVAELIWWAEVLTDARTNRPRPGQS
ncbi:NAD(P)H-dependent oxidoreductase [Natronosporangium hydrolyticum]|uniref:NAD(P)H-dependent oxidoreductase n=1 Tax=Natronosporangium hydrolyticum TaxID=2811111 RepID=A0A895YMU0_9ACTN|nr:NAD(P)H-dependent oxidoreductase [Natronosporangium hydrolyticum]QSB16623.1 NAD(P)H-dependent oxidoreductase [Natronosporangium hydrolyticum]